MSKKKENVSVEEKVIRRFALVDLKGYEESVIHLENYINENSMFQGKCFDISTWDIDTHKAEFEEEYLSYEFYIKCDGCSHLTFGDEDRNGYLHICGIDMYLKFMRGVMFSYILADHIMQVSKNNTPFTPVEEVSKWKATLNGYKITENGNVIISL